METSKILGYYELGRDEDINTSAWRINDNVFMPHFHSTIELMYVEEGAILALQDGVSHLAQKGFLVVNSGYMVHSCFTPEHSRIIVATIPLAAIPSLKGLLTQHSFKQGIIDTKCIPECRRILRMMSDPAALANAHFVNSLAEALLALLIEKIGLTDNTADAAGDLIKRILNYMQINAANPLTVDAVAAHFGYSTGRFSHIFNKRIGCSFTQYLNFLRCRMAQSLLDSTDTPLIDIASTCGFSSLRTFYRVYKTFSGHTPKRRGERRDAVPNPA